MGQLMAPRHLEVGGPGIWRNRGGRERCKKRSDRGAIRLAQRLREILHDLVAAGASGVVAQLLVEIVCRLSSESRNFSRWGPLAVRTVTSLTDRRRSGTRPFGRGSGRRGRGVGNDDARSKRKQAGRSR